MGWKSIAERTNFKAQSGENAPASWWEPPGASLIGISQGAPASRPEAPFKLSATVRERIITLQEGFRLAK
jgi:hypothetical protein